MYLKALASGLVLAISAWSAQAQITVDVSKVTCGQFVHAELGTPRMVALWFSGFYHGKNNIRTYEPLVFEQHVSKMQNFCYQENNFKVLLIEAIDRVLGAGK